MNLKQIAYELELKTRSACRWNAIKHLRQPMREAIAAAVWMQRYVLPARAHESGYIERIGTLRRERGTEVVFAWALDVGVIVSQASIPAAYTEQADAAHLSWTRLVSLTQDKLEHEARIRPSTDLPTLGVLQLAENLNEWSGYYPIRIPTAYWSFGVPQRLR